MRERADTPGLAALRRHRRNGAAVHLNSGSHRKVVFPC